MNIRAILDKIDQGGFALPEFQRGYVWNRDQVRRLMQSLYFRYPVGSLLVWETPTSRAVARGNQSLQTGSVKLLLDGQQRITSLYGLVRGRAPAFFEGNDRAFTDLFFHLEEERFAFYQPIKMRDDPMWIDVTELFQESAGVMIQKFMRDPDYQERLTEFMARLNRIDQIQEIDLHIEEITGEDKTNDVVVDIFNRVNSGGTKLSKGDLALAKICASWPEARRQINDYLEHWVAAGFHFRLELFLRCVTTVLTGEAFFTALDGTDNEKIKAGFKKGSKHVDTLLNLIGSRLGLDHDRVFGGRYALPLMARYLEQRGGAIADPTERDKLLYWYVHSFLWGRYAGSTESTLNQDLSLIKETDGGLDRLIELLRRDCESLRLQADDFWGWSRGSRFYPLLYMLTRVWQARDWETGIELKSHLLGNLARLELHHIFPKSLLYDKEYERWEVNALANFTFLTQDTNLKVSNQNPADYLAAYADKDPDLLSSHWIPMDPELWQIDRYKDFLAARRELLAAAANNFLDTLYRGEMPEEPVETPVVEREVVAIPGGIAHEEEESRLLETNQWVMKQGLPGGELSYELVDSESGKCYGVLDLAWPGGLQEGLSVPVALLIDEPKETENAANRAGFRFFTEVATFRTYVEQEVLGGEEA
ncbi:MAG: DUF262 domain-containing protein [Gammaproteobacteria bacterium]|nr:DUF262 domain-containing protein [Gammaproteobacteria bacterium]